MQKNTKELFITLKALRPIVHGISNYYGIDWKDNRLVEYWYLEYPNQHFKFASEKELCNELRRLIASTQSDLGFRLPHTVKKLKLE
jgi:hypothetical protein